MAVRALTCNLVVKAADGPPACQHHMLRHRLYVQVQDISLAAGMPLSAGRSGDESSTSLQHLVGNWRLCNQMLYVVRPA
jgi:hypothetical protein